MNMQRQGLQHMRRLVSQYQKQVEKIRGIAHKPQKFLHSVYGLIVWTKFQPCFQSHQQGVLHLATV